MKKYCFDSWDFFCTMHSILIFLEKLFNFQIQKNEHHGIMEDRISLKNKKLQRSSIKITTCDRFQKLNNDTLQELCQVRQQLGTT